MREDEAEKGSHDAGRTRWAEAGAGVQKMLEPRTF